MDHDALRFKTVLVVDDQEEARGLISAFLRKMDCRVYEACDGLEALEVAAGVANLDLLVADVVMPRMDGPELVEKLLGTRPELRALFVSGYTAGPTVHGLMRNPRVGFLQKPFSFRAFQRHACHLMQEPELGRARPPGTP